MFEGFPEVCRAYRVPADVRAILTLRRSMDHDLVNTMGDLYTVLKAIIVKDQQYIGPFTQAYYDYFLGIDVKKGEKLDMAVGRSDAFAEWRKMYYEGDERRQEMDMRELVDKFLDEVHMTSYDIKKMFAGEDILSKDDPDMADNGDPQTDKPGGNIDQAADYRNIDIEELRKRMERVAQQQNKEHHGGDHWIGTGGRSAYGHSGAAMGGIRVGGKGGGGRMARMVMDDKNFYPVDVDALIQDDNIDAALAALKGVKEETAQMYLDIPDTLKIGLKRGGLFLPIEKERIEEKMQVLLMIDNGGYSMDYFIRSVTTLFKKMKTRYAHDLEVRYFHNTIREYVYKDERRTKPEHVDKILSMDPNYRVFVVGDAAMGPYELTESSVHAWTAIADKFQRTAWLNPVPEKYWGSTYTTQILASIIDMHEMTPRGIEKAIRKMNKVKNKVI